MDSKDETVCLDVKILKKIGFLKKKAHKTNFGYESYALLKKSINNNQISTWKVEVGPHDDSLPSLTFPIRLLVQIRYLWSDPLL